MTYAQIFFHIVLAEAATLGVPYTQLVKVVPFAFQQFTSILEPAFVSGNIHNNLAEFINYLQDAGPEPNWYRTGCDLINSAQGTNF